jgi:hypothetical protein
LASEALENETKAYFSPCPICGKEETMLFDWSGSSIEMYCKECYARWRVHTGWSGHFNGAELMKPNVQGKGTNLLGFNYPPDFWQKMVRVSEKPVSETIAIKEKETIREREVIIKIRCPYCHNPYDETLDKCPHCGGAR